MLQRLNPPTRAKRTLDETQGRSTPVSRPKRTPKSSAAPSPAPPVLVKEEPMDYEETKSGEITNDARLVSIKTELKKVLQ